MCIGFLASVQWYRSEHYLLNNAIGISVSVQAISFINPGSYFTAALLLVLLFFYDIFWVFGTDVMATVAKGLNVPIKLIFPRPAISPHPSMLGLGDIVLPGIYIALLLRFDVFRKSKSIQSQNNSEGWNFGIISGFPYFWVSLLGYTLSMGTCLVVMFVFEHAQPALLYLVPGVLIPILVQSLFNQDHSLLWKYDEEAISKEKEKEKEKNN